MTKFIYILITALAATPAANAQPFNYLHHYRDSTYDVGNSILLRSDNTILVSGGCYEPVSDNQAIADAAWMNVSANGAVLHSSHYVHKPEMGMWYGYPGCMKQAPGMGYAIPYTIDPVIYPAPEPNKWVESAGLVLVNFQLDTILTAQYTDTNTHGERLSDCGILPNGNVLLAGWQHPVYIYPGTRPQGMAICVSQTGTMLWKKVYPLVGVSNCIESVEPLDNYRTLLGGYATDSMVVGNNTYYPNRPRFLIINNSDGNIIRDTTYGAGYTGGGIIFKDVNGGYYHTAQKDSSSSDWADPSNYPPYLAHLDTNFKIEWQTTFSFNYQQFKKSILRVHQLQNGDFLVCGSGAPGNVGWGIKGWAARVDAQGYIIWSKYYQTDNWNAGTLYDFVERQDGSIVFSGIARNDTSNMEGHDVWLLATDANGDVLPENTFAKNTANHSISIALFPNPNSGHFMLDAPEQGIAEIYDMSGKLLDTKAVAKGRNQIQLSITISPGTYLLQFAGNESGLMAGKKLVIE